MKQQRQQRLRRLWRDFVRPALLVVVIITAFRLTIADWNDVPSGSMNPTILEGDRILVNKLAYDVRLPLLGAQLYHRDDPQPGDVIVFHDPEEGRRMVKRVIAGPGQRVAMSSNRLYVDDQPSLYQALDPQISYPLERRLPGVYQFASELLAGKSYAVMLTPSRRVRDTFAPITVPEGHYFVLGDNRDNSRDSRYFGCVPRDAVVGRADSVIFSVNYDDNYLFRPGRYFTSIQ